MEYGAPSYDNSAYYYGNDQAHYTKVDFTNSGNLYKFTLPNPVEANQTTAVVVAYAARGYVKIRSACSSSILKRSKFHRGSAAFKSLLTLTPTLS